MAQRTVPAPFLTKTYQLVEDPSTNDVVSWNESGSTFVVWNIDEFAKTLLPNYFKHNNFSSFVRQLNTYGFRKIVPDKWEFANQYFKREQKDLLSEIRRRKITTSTTAQIPSVGKSLAVFPSPSNSGDDLGSTSTSSPDSKNPGSVETVPVSQFADISGENEKLKKDNEILSSEISQAKKQCEELIAFLTEYVKVGPDQINLIMRQGTCGSTRDGLLMDGADHVKDDDENGVHEEEEESLKLFGVWLKKKRGREEKMGFCGPNAKEMKKTVEFQAPVMMMKRSRVCN